MSVLRNLFKKGSLLTANDTLVDTEVTETVMFYSSGSQALGREPFVGRGHIFLGPFIFSFLYCFKILFKNINKGKILIDKTSN